MDLITLSVVLIALLFVFLAAGVWIAVALGIIGFVAMVVAAPAPPGPIMASAVWSSSISWSLTALPMFILMGEILFRTRLSEDLFRGLAPWLQPLPGRLIHTNVVGCTVFAAVSGSSAATCATIGRMSIPELKKRGYPQNIAIGSLAGAGTLGLLIPPSLIMIVYSAATDESVARLFISGVIPGLLLAGLFMLYIMAWSALNPKAMPAAEPRESIRDRLDATLRLVPVTLLIIGIIASIYGGLASATEAAVVGVFLSLLIAWWQGTLSWDNLKAALVGAARTSCMICFILAGAAFLTVAMGFTGIPRSLAEWVGSLGLEPWQLILALTIFFVILGCFLDGISMIVLTTSVVMPMIDAAGIDRIWFGIFLVIVVEMAQITPPVGFNLFVLQTMTGENIFRLGLWALPFFLLMALMVVVLFAFPDIALWLPRQMLDA